VNLDVHFSSKTQEWETPQWLFDELNAEFHFTLDPCANPENAKCARYFTKEMDGLARSWVGHGVFMNPPYGREIESWVYKAWSESRLFTHQMESTLVVGLLPARTDTRWFHEYIYDRATEIRFLKGRLRFVGAKHSAPFPSMVVIWK